MIQVVVTKTLATPFFDPPQAAAPYLKKSRGSVVNVADILGERPNPPFNVYCITKATMLMITKSLALELAPEVRKVPDTFANPHKFLTRNIFSQDKSLSGYISTNK